MPITVYELLPDSRNFHDFALVDSANGDIFARFDGQSLEKDWKPLEITVADEDDELAHLADYALLGTIPVLSSRAVSFLRDTLEAYGELLPLVYSRNAYFAYNITHFVDALDDSRSVVTRLSSGRIMSVERYVFRADAVDRELIFKVPQFPRAFVFATDAFARVVREFDLTGFAFRALWAAEHSQPQAN